MKKRKIIFSRKGIDSQYRPVGVSKSSSPIFEDGSLFSIPIPANGQEAGIPYKEVPAPQYGNAYQLIKKLYPKSKGFTRKANCHYDPFLPADNSPYIGAFGQHGAAASHLDKQEVGEGDIFLFYGTFQPVVAKGKELFFEKAHPVHLIFGYLEVDSIWKPQDPVPEVLPHSHPHVANKDHYSQLNRIYIAKEKSTIMPNMAGWGSFSFSESRVLTKLGYQKSVWELPAFFHPSKDTIISYHERKSCFEEHGNNIRLQSVGRGQEFVVQSQSHTAQKQLMNYVKEVYQGNQLASNK